MKNEKKILSAIVVSLMLASCGDDKAADSAAASASTIKSVTPMSVVMLNKEVGVGAKIDLLSADLSIASTAAFDVDSADGKADANAKAYAAALKAATTGTTAKFDASKPIVLDLTGVKATVTAAQTADKFPVINVRKLTLDATSNMELFGVAAVAEVKDSAGAVTTPAVKATRLNVGEISSAKGATFTLATAGELSLSSGTLNSVVEVKDAATIVFDDYTAADADAKLLGVNRTLTVGAHGELKSATDTVIPAGQKIILNAAGMDAITDAIFDADAAVKTAKGLVTAAATATTAADAMADDTVGVTAKADAVKKAKEDTDAAATALVDAKAAVTTAESRKVAGTLTFGSDATKPLSVMGMLQVDFQNIALQNKKIIIGSVKDDALKTVDAAGNGLFGDGIWGDVVLAKGKFTLSGKDTTAETVTVGKGGTFTFGAKKIGNVDLAENATFVSTGEFDGTVGDFTLIADKAHNITATTGKTLTVGTLTMNKFSNTTIKISDAGMVTKGVDASAFVTAYTPVFADSVAKVAVEKAAEELKAAIAADTAASTDETQAKLKEATAADTVAKAEEAKTVAALTADANKLQLAYNAAKAAAVTAAAVDGSTLVTSKVAMTIDGKIKLTAVNKNKIPAGSIIKILHSDASVTSGADLKWSGDALVKLADATKSADLTTATAVLLKDADVASKDLFLLTLAEIAAAPAAASASPAPMMSSGVGSFESALFGAQEMKVGAVSIASTAQGQTGQLVGFSFAGMNVYASYETSTNAINSAAAAYKTSFGGFDLSSNVVYAVNKSSLGDLNVDSKTFASQVQVALPMKALGATFTPSAFAGYGVIASDNSTLVSGDSFNAGTSASFAGAAFKASTDFSFKSVAFKAFANFSAASEFAARGSENGVAATVAPTQSSAMFGVNAAVDSSTSVSAQAGVVKNNNLDAAGKFELAMNIKL